MIIFENKGFQTRSDKPCEDWTGEAKYIVDDNSPLVQKIMEFYPYYDFVLDDGGNLVDIIPTERPPVDTTAEQIAALKADLGAEDYKGNKLVEELALYLVKRDPALADMLPYDIIALHAERQAKRDKINELEKESADETTTDI